MKPNKVQEIIESMKATRQEQLDRAKTQMKYLKEEIDKVSSAIDSGGPPRYLNLQHAHEVAYHLATVNKLDDEISRLKMWL